MDFKGGGGEDEGLTDCTQRNYSPDPSLPSVGVSKEREKS